ncbi:MAG TPA: alpha/beta hydrolase-fold protein [Thermoanaerobaculia bacterium]|nr:alpha/beta hydrolase-fold protein [Thermoanaerobaculia bacterium]
MHYPLDGGALKLRTEEDWSRDVEPVAANAGGTTFDFEITLERPFLYYKPVLQRHGELRWSQGPNHLLLANGRKVRDLYPYFYADLDCGVCDLQPHRSRAGDRQHNLRIFTPPGYEENTLQRYPVLYMQDGQNLFFPNEATNGQHWKVEETLLLLGTMNLIKKVIVVGIYPQERLTDYTRPGYESYGRYLAEELKPWVDERHRTLPGHEHTAVAGASLGGVVSCYLGWQYPEVFGMAASMSATFTYQDDLMERVRLEEKRPTRFYLDSGWPEDNYEVTRAMRNALLTRGYVEGRDLLYFAFPEALHNEQSWSLRLHLPFQYFFGRSRGL